MLRPSHIIVSETILMSGCLWTQQSLPFVLTSATGVWLGAQLPDIDQSQNRLDRFFPPFRLIAHHVRHRTWTHCWLAVLVMAVLAFVLPVPSHISTIIFNLPINFLNGLLHPTLSPNSINPFNSVYFSIVFGYFLHNLEDSFSHQGICWFYPITRFHHRRGTLYKPSHQHWWFYRTGGTGEKIIRRFSSIVLLIELIMILIGNIIGYSFILKL